MRVFIAIPFDQMAKEKLCQLQECWKGQGMSGKWIPEENFHLTLAFIGEASQNQAYVIWKILQENPMPSLSLDFDKAGHFGNLYWAGIQDNEDLTAYACKIRELLKDKNIPFDAKPFKAHLTLIRKASLEKDAKISAPDFQTTVDQAVLMESVFQENKTIYNVVSFEEMDDNQ